jgi:hypothetical protein
MAKKNILIESIVKSLTGKEKDWKLDEMKKILSELNKFSFRSTFFGDKLFEDNTLNFILENEKDSKIYIHYTRDENDAKSILSEGFKFVDSFYKTALSISNDKLDFMIKHNNRKSFGDYLIVLGISNEIIKYYSEEMEKAGVKNYFFENILTESPPVKNDNADIVYLLPNKFVKGYVNHVTGEIISNPDFNPGYSSPGFKANIGRLKEGNRYILNNNQ